MKKSIEKIIVDIIKHELDLPDNYGKTSKGDIILSIIIYGQNINLFNTDKMQITGRTVSSNIIFSGLFLSKQVTANTNT